MVRFFAFGTGHAQSPGHRHHHVSHAQCAFLTGHSDTALDKEVEERYQHRRRAPAERPAPVPEDQPGPDAPLDEKFGAIQSEIMSSSGER